MGCLAGVIIQGAMDGRGQQGQHSDTQHLVLALALRLAEQQPPFAKLGPHPSQPDSTAIRQLFLLLWHKAQVPQS